jgi:type I restriction-modification system DNA methylase subunit
MYRSLSSVRGYSSVVELETLRARDYDLSVSRHIQVAPPQASSFGQTIQSLRDAEERLSRAEENLRRAYEALGVQMEEHADG